MGEVREEGAFPPGMSPEEREARLKRNQSSSEKELELMILDPVDDEEWAKIEAQLNGEGAQDGNV